MSASVLSVPFIFEKNDPDVCGWECLPVANRHRKFQKRRIGLVSSRARLNNVNEIVFILCCQTQLNIADALATFSY